MKLHVWHYLLNHTFRQLEDDHGVSARLSSDKTKLSLNYDQISSKSGDPVSEQCRGLIIRPSSVSPFWKAVVLDNDEWKDVCIGEIEVVAWPMSRFYNHGDHHAAVVNWEDPGLRVYEKLDGTCIICYFDIVQNRWRTATRSVSEADLPINPNNPELGNTTFSGLFLKALVATRESTSGKKIDWVVDGPDKVVHLNKELTYVFELVSRFNQIVVDYPEPRVYLLAVRHTSSGDEIAIENIRLEHVLRPRVWPLTDATSVAAFVDSTDPSQLEGAVVCDSQFRRLKLKNTAYVLAHRSKDAITSSPRNVIKAILREKLDDIIPLLPKDLATKYLEIQDRFGQYCKEADTRFKEFKIEAGEDRKRFAEQVMLSGDFSAPYFHVWEGRVVRVMDWFTQAEKADKLSDSTYDAILNKIKF